MRSTRPGTRIGPRLSRRRGPISRRASHTQGGQVWKVPRTEPARPGVSSTARAHRGSRTRRTGISVLARAASLRRRALFVALHRRGHPCFRHCSTPSPSRRQTVTTADRYDGTTAVALASAGVELGTLPRRRDLRSTAPGPRGPSTHPGRPVQADLAASRPAHCPFAVASGGLVWLPLGAPTWVGPVPATPTTPARETVTADPPEVVSSTESPPEACPAPDVSMTGGRHV